MAAMVKLIVVKKVAERAQNPLTRYQGVVGWQHEMLTQSDWEDGKNSTLSPSVICKF